MKQFMLTMKYFFQQKIAEIQWEIARELIIWRYDSKWNEASERAKEDLNKK